ncbi:MAG TPA: hypothetical protein VH370_01580 [Humisphaera sp.]|jgi:hypothetical protein|nr:hypothetical protein [Humisphaera sp.]
MLRIAGRLIFAFLIAGGAAAGGWLLWSRNSTEHELARQRDRNEQLQLIVQRLSTEHRVGDIIVTDQTESAGAVKTQLLFVEYAADGSALPAKQFTIDGKLAHIDAMVIKFDGKFVQENDPLRGHSIALFTRLYGESQSPAAGFAIDPPGSVPAVYHIADARAHAFEQQLWGNFWKLADDPEYRKSMGVRVAQGEAVWRSFEPGWLYTLTLEANGGLNITPERMKGIYRAAMQKQQGGRGAVSRTD